MGGTFYMEETLRSSGGISVIAADNESPGLISFDTGTPVRIQP
jgi:hypothetical protein